MKVALFAAAALGAVTLSPPPANAHHSFAMFDGDKVITLTGTAKELEWANPHCWLYVMIEGDNGKAIEYPLEMQGPGQAIKMGWTPDIVKPGDKITVDIHPLRTGAHGGQLLSVVLANGHKLGVTGRPANPLGN